MNEGEPKERPIESLDRQELISLLYHHVSHLLLGVRLDGEVSEERLSKCIETLDSLKASVEPSDAIASKLGLLRDKLTVIGGGDTDPTILDKVDTLLEEIRHPD